MEVARGLKLGGPIGDRVPKLKAANKVEAPMAS